MHDAVLYLAPVLGVTDWIFRSAFMRVFGGFDFAVTPFVKTIKGGGCRPGKLLDFLPQNNKLLPIHPQILTGNPDDFLEMASALFDLGYQTVNLNLGCPMPTSTKKNKGAGLLPQADRLDAFLAKVTRKMQPRLSLKIRTGLDDNSDLDGLIPVFNRYPLQEIIVHPRTAKQRYSGALDFTSFEKCLAEILHEIVYNGDIRTIQDFDQLSGRYVNVKKWMIGRGALQDPLLPGAIKNCLVSRENKLDLIRTFHEELLVGYSQKLQSDRAVIAHMMGLWIYLAGALALSDRHLKNMAKAKNLTHYRDLFAQACAAEDGFRICPKSQ